MIMKVFRSRRTTVMRYDVSGITINQHIKEIYDDSEPEPETTIKNA